MKNIFHIIIILAGLSFGQTAEQINKAKEVIQRTGLSESQAREAAKARGYTDKQIDTAIQKEKASKAGSGESVPESTEKVDLPELGKSNEVVQEQPVLETIVGEELPVIGKDDLEIVDESGLNIKSEAQPARGDAPRGVLHTLPRRTRRPARQSPPRAPPPKRARTPRASSRRSSPRRPAAGEARASRRARSRATCDGSARRTR